MNISDTHLPSGHPDVLWGRIGVLLINLGTPEATDYWSMRRYLKEFLSDRRVIEVPRWIWWPLLNGVILTTRPTRSGEAYRKIWNTELDESPLKTITRSQCEKLSAALEEGTPGLQVDWAMRYGKPSIAEKLKGLAERGCDRILIFPLYPQYSAATTATVNDTVFDVLKGMRWQPSLRIVPPFYDEDVHIGALATSLKDHLAQLDFTPDRILASFHGLPQEYFDKGDPYHCHCQKTGRLLREAAGIDEDRFLVTFQSRFGRAEWIKPYTDDTIARLAQEGVRNMVVITPGFVADCVETLEEIALEAGETFHENGGENFSVVPCLNDSRVSIEMLRAITESQLSGWL